MFEDVEDLHKYAFINWSWLEVGVNDMMGLSEHWERVRNLTGLFNTFLKT